ncbi:MAG: ribonuclease P protein component [Pseudomonadota bacterium]
MGRYQFRKSNRLSKPAEYKAVFSNGKRHELLPFVILQRRNEVKEPRLGLAISKKHVPLAAHRNSLKRIIRESFRENNANIVGWDVVVVTKRKVNMTNVRQFPRLFKRYWASFC